MVRYHLKTPSVVVLYKGFSVIMVPSGMEISLLQTQKSFGPLFEGIDYVETVGGIC